MKGIRKERERLVSLYKTDRVQFNKEKIAIFSEKVRLEGEMYSYDSGMKHKDQDNDTSLMSQLKAKQAEADAQKKAAEPAKTETKQVSAGSALMGMLAGFAVDMAVSAAKTKAADTVKAEVLKAAKGKGR